MNIKQVNDHSDVLFLKEKFGFKLNYEIENTDQKSLINFVVDQGKISRFIISNQNYIESWYFFTFHAVVNVDEMEKKFNISAPLDFKLRFEESCLWGWVDSEKTQLVRFYVDKLKHLFKKITRVQIIVQRPNMPLPLHRDLAFGENYSDGKLSHKRNVLSLKIPLSNEPNSNGVPIICVNDKVFRYDVGRSFFAINEVEMLHGSKPVPFYRGVICVDGILDFEKLSIEKKQLIELKSLS
jgi:hypothetical protein